MTIYDNIRRNNEIVDDVARDLINAEKITVYTKRGALEYTREQFRSALAHSKKSDIGALSFVAGTVSRASVDNNIYSVYVNSRGVWSLAYLIAYDTISKIIVDYCDASRYSVRYK